MILFLRSIAALSWAALIGVLWVSSGAFDHVLTDRERTVRSVVLAVLAIVPAILIAVWL
jgi:hypothetical protein